MKLIKTFFILSLSILITSFQLIDSNNNNDQPLNNQSKYILVRDGEMMRSGIKKLNAAILITDIEKIKQDESLFLGNKSSPHACGYHYNIQFWQNCDQLIEEFPFNKECEEFMNNNLEIQSRMKDYISILESKPTQFIYNLKIRTNTDPQIVKKAFENTNMRIFFLNGKTEHLPHLVFTYRQVSNLKEMEDKSNSSTPLTNHSSTSLTNQWEEEQNANRKLAIDKMQSIVDEIEKVATIVEQSKISFPMEGFGKTIEHKAELTLKFSRGVDLLKVKNIIMKNGGEIDQERNPEFYYVQLVDASQDIATVKKKIKNFKFVLNVFEYPSIADKK